MLTTLFQLNGGVWVTPRTWLRGTEAWTAAQMNQQVRDDFTVLHAPRKVATSHPGNLGAAQSIDATNGTVWLQGVLNANCTVTVSNLLEGARVRLFVTQDATGGRVLTVADETTSSVAAITSTAGAVSAVEVFRLGGSSLLVSADA